MNKLATKTKNRTSRLFVIVLIILGAMIIFVAPLVHIDFPKKNPNIVEFENKLDNDISALDSSIKALRSDYDNGEISAVEYIQRNDILVQNRANRIQHNAKLLSELVESSRVFGWKTTRIFLVGFGIRLPYLMFSLLISFLILMIDVRDKVLKRAFLALQALCYSISIYELVWVFWDSQDYPLEVYRFAIIAICVMVGTACAYSFKYYYSRLDRLTDQVDSIWDFLVEVRNKHYKRMLKRAIAGNLYDEAYQDGIKKDTKEFEKRIYDKADEIMD